MSTAPSLPRPESFDSPSRTIVVLGATGQQGSGTILHLLTRTSFRIVGITRAPTSTASRSLLVKYKQYVDAGRFELVPADVGDKDSLVKAFEGAWGVFGVTQYTVPLKTEEDLAFDLVGGKNIIDAAKDTNVSHLVYSGLPSPSRATQGRFQHVYHFEHKSTVEAYGLSILGRERFSIIHGGLFYNNFTWPQYAKKSEKDGVLEFKMPLREGKLQAWADPSYDVGLFVSELFLLGPSLTGGKTYPIHSSPVTLTELSRRYTGHTGLPSRVAPSTLSDWTSTVVASEGPGIARDITEMVQFFGWSPYEEGKMGLGCMEREEYEARMKELGGRVRASTFEEWLNRSGYQPSG